MRCIVRSCAVTLVAVVALTGCGDDDGSTSPAAEPSTESATGAQPTGETSAEESTDGGTAVELVTADGETLQATAFGPAGPTAVVLAHMRGAGKETWFEFAERLAEEGIGAVALDFRGYGESTGERDTSLDVDVAAAVEHVQAQGATDVYVFGASMGGTATVVAASELELAGVATLSAPASFGSLDALGAASEVDEPALHVAAASDQPYADNAEAIGERSGGEVVVLDGNAHGTNLFSEHGSELTNLLLEFVGA